MTDQPQKPERAHYAPPTLTVHGKMVVLTAQGTKPGNENHGNVNGRRP